MTGSGLRAAAAAALLVVLGACSGPEEPRTPAASDSAAGCVALVESARPQPSASAPSDDLVQEFTDSIKHEPWFNGAGLSADESGYFFLVFAREDPDLAPDYKGVRVKVCRAGPFFGS